MSVYHEELLILKAKDNGLMLEIVNVYSGSDMDALNGILRLNYVIGRIYKKEKRKFWFGHKKNVLEFQKHHKDVDINKLYHEMNKTAGYMVEVMKNERVFKHDD